MGLEGDESKAGRRGGEKSGGGEWKRKGEKYEKAEGRDWSGERAEARDWLGGLTGAPTSPGVKVVVRGGKLGVRCHWRGQWVPFQDLPPCTWHRLSRPGLVEPSLPHPGWAQGCVECLSTCAQISGLHVGH